ncbi:MAG: hypothetical protein QXK37_01555 [Candidatus Woesearchaeota archaeon]
MTEQDKKKASLEEERKRQCIEELVIDKDNYREGYKYFETGSSKKTIKQEKASGNIKSISKSVNIESSLEKEKLTKKSDSEPKGLSDTHKVKYREIEEMLFRENYERTLKSHMNFLLAYLREGASTRVADYEYISQDGRKASNIGEELISYDERKEVVRTIQMNALMQGNHNYVSPHLKELYEHWKNINKFNMLLSFMMYERITGGW